MVICLNFRSLLTTEKVVDCVASAEVYGADALNNDIAIFWKRGNGVELLIASRKMFQREIQLPSFKRSIEWELW